MPGPDGVPVEIPVDISRPNPNGEEFDCLYLDMNGIVHPCTHPEGKPAPETEEEMMVEVFKYTERVVNMIRPRKLLMMAIDGVAPRAKMNQQRSRRFRSAQDAKILQDQREMDLEERRRRGQAADDEVVKTSWDSNAITPGTPFMDLLASSLRYWIARKLNTDPGWKNLCVVLSDASVPGEGEHKIMDYIRRKRSDPNHDPNTKHVIYGLDADLIMLSLATHEPHFKVLREDVFAQDLKNKGGRRYGQEGHFVAPYKEEPHKDTKSSGKKPFIFLDVPTLREYLSVELQTPGISFPFDLERAIDDWVFLIFFVGNDFLPHLPSLEIREGAIDTLLKIWKRELPRMTGYVTNNGRVELSNAQFILDGLAQAEDDIFRKRKETEERQEANKRRNASSHHREMQYGETNYVEVKKAAPASKVLPPQPQGTSKPVPGARHGKGPVMLDQDSMDVVKHRAQIRMANINAAEEMRAELQGKKTSKRSSEESESARKRTKAEPDTSAESTLFKLDEELPKDSAVPQHERAKTLASATEGGKPVPESRPSQTVKADVQKEETSTPAKASADQAATPKAEDSNDMVKEEEEDTFEDDDDAPPDVKLERKVNADGTVDYEDTVKLWEPGYRERYYRQKFGVELSDTKFRRQVVQAYVEGLCWVLAYYYQGCPSWKWYYPYHYAPFAADFTDMASLDIHFAESKPFRPFEQLMGVLPAASKSNLPEPFQWLMTNEESEILDFYPTEFSIDMNGKKMAWQGVALLPFIDESRLLTALRQRYDQLTDDEVRRNSFGRNVLFVSEDADLFPTVSRLYTKRSEGRADSIDTSRNNQMAGSLTADPTCVPGSTYYSPLSSLPDMGDIENDRSISAYYDFPVQITPHRSILLRGVRLPPRRLTPADQDWVLRSGRGGHGSGGRGPRGRRDGWSDQGVMYGRDARPSGGGPYGAGPYGASPYGGGPYGAGPYGSGPYGGGPYGGGPYGGSAASGPYGAGPYGAGPYSGGSSYSYGQPYGAQPTYGAGTYGGYGPYGSTAYQSFGQPYAAYAQGPPMGAYGSYNYGHAGTAYGSSYGQNQPYGAGNGAPRPYGGYGSGSHAGARGSRGP